jgi:hypothetical protein
VEIIYVGYYMHTLVGDKMISEDLKVSIYLHNFVSHYVERMV